MNDLKAFVARVSEDPGLAKKVMAAKDAAEIVSIAATAGYQFTEDDLLDERMSQVAGGNETTDKIAGALYLTGSAANSGAQLVQTVGGFIDLFSKK